MRINRARLLEHLSKISVGGYIDTVVLTERWGSTALSQDHQLLVLAPPLEAIEPLTVDEIGISDLSLLLHCLKDLSGTGNEGTDVYMRFEDHRLVIDEDYRGVIRLVPANPQTISTRVENETVEKLLKIYPDGERLPLNERTIHGARRMFSRLFAGTRREDGEVELFVGPEGAWLTVGNGVFHVADIPLRGEVGAEYEHSWLFGEALISVLGVVTSYADAFLVVGEDEKSFLAVEDGDYRFLVSPKDRGADGSESYWRTRKRDPVPA